jgi:hypothetical protein
MAEASLQALTAYGVAIPKSFADRSHALKWAEENGHTYPGCRIVTRTAKGLRTIWRQTEPQTSVAA